MTTSTCPVCGFSESLEVFTYHDTCGGCGSSARQRAVALAVLASLGLMRHNSLNECPMDKSRAGLGISDWFYIAGMLSYKFNYVNSFVHMFPYLDITNPDPRLKETFEFCVCSDVLEHVTKPVDEAFQGLHEIIKPNGFLIASVPILNIDSEIIEHYPNLYDFEIKKNDNGERVLLNTTVLGVQEVFHNLKFHGGQGDTLEVRQFSKKGFLNSLKKNGFEIVKLIENDFRYGVGPFLESGSVVLAKKISK